MHLDVLDRYCHSKQLMVKSKNFVKMQLPGASNLVSAIVSPFDSSASNAVVLTVMILTGSLD